MRSLALVLAGTIMAPLYRKFRLEPQNLSRSLEDCATTGAAIVPWCSTAIFFSATLGVSTLTYAPFTFFSFLCPILALIYGMTGFTITKYDDPEPTHERNGKSVTGFDRDANIFRGMLVKSDGRTYVRCPEGRFNLAAPDDAACAPGSPAALVVRPDQLRLTNPHTKPGPDENAISATVRDVIDCGGEREYILDSSANEELICRHRAGTSEIELRPGDDVTGCWKVEHGVVVSSPENL